ncbi:ABC transporter ATP-binding protein [Paracoccus sp. S-4012]|uniref:ABC transporter ATP-binding protein n=1 Tax=Paracoccus sp. S-4012 TaxID=2665648 RepID=UPI00351B318F
MSDGDRGWSADPAKRNSGLVFQSYALWPHMTVRGNVEWPLKVAGVARAERESRTAEVLRMLGIDALAGRYPNEISGGQQQRVAIARTIVTKPGVLLFDEPLSNLDAKLRVEMRTELMRLHRATGATTVYVTHDQIEAMTMATHVAVMNAGRVEQFGTPQDLVDRPATAFVATFVGTPPSNLVPVLRNGTGWTVGGRHIAIEPPQDGALAMFRAETLGLAPASGPRTLPLEMAEVSTIAGRTMVTGLGAGGLRLTAVTEAIPTARVGDTIHLALPEAPSAWFAPTGERIG